jgi:hypothetical protein
MEIEPVEIKGFFYTLFGGVEADPENYLSAK